MRKARTMHHNKLAIAFVAALVLVASIRAAKNPPQIGYIYPAGGQQGASFTATIGGQFLENATNVHLNVEGIDVEFLEYKRPFNNRELKVIKEKVRGIRDAERAKSAKKKKSGAEGTEIAKQIRDKIAQSKPDPRFEKTRKRMLPIIDSCLKDEMTPKEQIAALRKMIPKKGPKIQENKQLEESVIVRITLGKNLDPGNYELRLFNDREISNPIRFRCDGLPELLENEPNNLARDIKDQNTVVLPATLNGQILPGDTDRFRFAAKAGERILIQTRARELVPYLADAVPGWFQATLAIYDDKQREIAYADDYLFHPDPVLTAEIPRAGVYTLEIRDAIYRGREDFVYRISMQKIDRETPLETLSDPVRERLGLRMRGLPKVAEAEPNNQKGTAQRIKLPALIYGRIGSPGDSDIFRIRGRKGDELVAEVCGRRINSPIDSLLLATDSDGNTIGMNDDDSDRGSADHLDRRAGLITHDSDSYLHLRLPDDGDYFIQLRDIQSKGGKDYRYALRLSRPRPDFTVKIVPSSIALRRGNAQPIEVYAQRRDGFEGPIEVELVDAPRAIELDGNTIPAGCDKLAMTISTRNPDLGTTPLEFVARADIGDKTVERSVVPADDVMQAFLNRHLVTAAETVVCASKRWGAGLVIPKQGRQNPLLIQAGKTTEVVLVRLGKRRIRPELRVSIREPKSGIDIAGTEISSNGKRMTLTLEVDKNCPPAGNIIISAEIEKTLKNGKTKKIPRGSISALPFVCKGVANAD